ncbi:MAG: phytanoyl-CoA dioxygenase family protein [Paracoccaceae bacterium]
MLDAQNLDQGRLTPDQTAQYWQDGFLFPLDVLTPDQATAARAEFETMERDWLDNGLPQPLNTYKRINAHCVMPLVYHMAMNPRVLDVVEGILGPNILIYSGEFFIKEAHTKHIVSMHQDLTYWGLGATEGLVTAWIALSPATRASGCMDFVAGTHKNEILPHMDTFDENNLLSRGQEVEVDVAEDDKTSIELQPGQMSLHHGLTVHGSGPNTSDDRRIGCVIRFCRPDVLQQVGDRDYAMVARGVDHVGNFIQVAPPMDYFQPSSLAVWDEIRQAQAQVMMKDAKGSSASGIYGDT